MTGSVPTPAVVVNRLERHLQRLPDAFATATANRDAALAEARRAETRIGRPWDRISELASLRRRQQEINDVLAASATGHVEPDRGIGANPTPATCGEGPRHPEPPLPTDDPVSRIKARLDALEHPAPRSAGIPR